MTVADLHVHTTNSDGSLPLAAVPEAAAAAGLDAVAVTDHDRLHPDLGAPVVTLEGTTVVHGIELRVAADDPRVDLLGYGAGRTDALEALVDRVQTDRVERGAEIIARVEERLGTDLPIEPERGIGRPHIAEAIAAVSEYDYGGAFAELIGDGCPCYVPREIPSFGTGVEVLREACGLVGLAHPLRYDDTAAALELCADLDAVERFYPYGRETDPGPIERAVSRYDLTETGGSDAHGDELGAAGLDAAAYRRFRTAL